MRLGGAKSFRAPSARESLFSAWPEKSNPKRGHPAWRFPGIPPGKCVRYGLAFRRHIGVPTKRNRRRADSPTGRTAMPHRRTGAPAEQRAVPARTRCAAAQRLQEQSARQQRASDVASRGVRAGARCSTRGPLCGGETGATGRKAGIDRRSMPFRWHTDVPSKSPPPAHGLFAHGWAKSAKRGGLSLGLLSLWPRKEKVTRAP